MKKGKKSLFRVLLCGLMAFMLMAGCLMTVHAEEGGIEFDLTASVTGDQAESINGMLSTAGINIKAGALDEALRLSVTARALGMDLVRAFAEITPERLAFAFPDIDTSRYEFRTDKIVELIEESPYGELIMQGGGSGAAFPIQGPQIDPEAYEEAFTPYFNYLGSFISERVQIEENAAIALERLGKKATGSVATLEPTAEDLAELLTTLSGMINQDEALAAIVNQWSMFFQNMDPATLAVINSVVTPPIDPAKTAQEISMAYSQIPDMLRHAAEDITESGMNGAVIRLTIAINESGAPVKASLYLGSEDQLHYYDFGFENAAAAAGADMILYMENETEKYALRLNGAGTTGTASVLVNNSPAAVLTYSFDPSTPSFLGIPSGTCVLNIMGMSMTLISSAGNETGSDYILQLSGLENATYSTDITGVNVKLHAGPAAVPEAPAGTSVDISDYSPEELAQVFGNIADAMAQKLENIFG